MKYKSYSELITLILFFTVIFTFNIDKASSHPAKEHKPLICILEEGRTANQKQNCKFWLFQHRLCKLDQDCAIIELEKKQQQILDNEKTIKQLEGKLGGIADCGDIPFNHKASENSKVYQKPDDKSEVIANIKKNQELLFIATSQDDNNWSYVKVKEDTTCVDGYLRQEVLIKKLGEDTSIKVGPKLISIIQPQWDQEEELITVNAEGTVSITGAIQEGKIDEIIINEEEETIISDNTFPYLLFVPNTGAEIRIIGNKNGKKVKELKFKIRVGK